MSGRSLHSATVSKAALERSVSVHRSHNVASISSPRLRSTRTTCSAMSATPPSTASSTTASHTGRLRRHIKRVVRDRPEGVGATRDGRGHGRTGVVWRERDLVEVLRDKR